MAKLASGFLQCSEHWATFTDDRNAGFEEFINTFEARYTNTTAPPSPRLISLNVTAEGLVQAPSVMPHPPCWLRFKKKLTHLPEVKRYKSDLALAFRRSGSSYDVILPPRFKFRFEEGRRRRPRRLFNSKFAFAAGFKGKAAVKGSKEHRFDLDGDEILEPFVLKSNVPLEAFQPHALVKAEDFRFFYVGMAEFWAFHPELSEAISRPFIQLTCRLYLRRALQIDEKVEAVSGYAVGTQGVIRDIDGTSCSVEVEGERGLTEMDERDLERWFQPGDHVRVHWSDQREWVGAQVMVLKLEGELVVVSGDNLADVSCFVPSKAIFPTEFAQEKFQTWQLVHSDVQFSFGPSPQNAPMPKFAKDRYRHLVGRRALVTGSHPKKGVLVDIKESLGNGLVRASNVGAQWTDQFPLTQLLDPEYVCLSIN
jgi:hypothetical protein